MRERLSFANVIACIALFIALGGSALAIKANTVGSRQVRDDSLKGRDIRDGTLRSGDLAADSVGPRELSHGVPVSEMKSGSGSCNPVSAAFVTCSTVDLNLQQPSRVLLVAGGGQFGEASASGSCEFRADSETLFSAAAPAFGADTTKTRSQTNGLALTAIAGSVDRIPPGIRSFKLMCNQVSSQDVKFETTLSAVAFGDGLG